ncbi:hypothetical protein AN390_00292 [Pseudoalteromonas sp. P1-11]|nr:hypothetical protein AN390_00292 [Pseudoalteromonas sp. P1-11]
MVSRREFLFSAGSLAFIGLSRSAMGNVALPEVTTKLPAYGPLIADPQALLDLPEGFSYRVISALAIKWMMV